MPIDKELFNGKTALELIECIKELKLKNAPLNGSQVIAMIEYLRTRLVEGEITTGDKISDFAIIKYGLDSRDREEAYYKLEKALSNSLAEFILISVKEEKPKWSESEDELGTSYHIEEHLYLGTVTGKKLLLGSPIPVGYEIPMNSVRTWYSVEPDKVSFAHEKFSSYWLGDISSDLNKPVISLTSRNLLEIRFQIIVGNENVIEWCKQNNHQDIFELLKKA